MKARSVTSMGALHPILFFAVMYVVVLFFSIFICSSLFYSCKSNGVKLAKKTTAPAKQQQAQAAPVQVSTAVVLR